MVKSNTKSNTSSKKTAQKGSTKNAKPQKSAKVAKNAPLGKLPEDVTFDVSQFSGGLKSAVEAILIAQPDAVDPAKLASILATNVEEVLQVLHILAAEYDEQNRGFELKDFDGLWKFYSRPEYGEAVTKFIIGNVESKLSIAALETLAIIAYKQPATRFDIAQIRGVNVDGVIRTLLQRGFIEEADHKKGDHELAAKYQTTTLFLEKMGLKSLDELEPLAPFLPDDISLIPQFDDIRKTARSNRDQEQEGRASSSSDNDNEKEA